MGGVPPARLPVFSALLQLLAGVLPDRLEHPVTGPATVRVDCHQRLLHQGPEVVYHPLGIDAPRGARLRPHSLGRREREAPDEHGEAPE